MIPEDELAPAAGITDAGTAGGQDRAGAELAVDSGAEPVAAESGDELTAVESSGEPATAGPKPRKKRGKGKWIAISVAAAVLLVGGGAVGYSLPDPKASDAYVALDKQKSAAEAQRDSARSDYDGLKTKYDTLLGGITSRENTVSKREAAVSTAETTLKDDQAAVKKREDAVSAVEQQKAANTVGDGTWVVGKDIEAGTYRANAAVDSTCYWGIYASGTNGGQIIENDLPGGGRPSVVLAAGQDFKSSRCGTWTKQ